MSADIAPSSANPPTAPDASTAPSAAAVADVAAGAPETSLAKFTARLPEITKQADYKEMWGVDLSADGHAPTQVVLLKFLRANNNDVAAAEKQLTSALEWRKKMQPAKLASETFDSKKFGDLGFVTVHKDDSGKETVITWNIYGAVKDNKATFGNVEEFIRWRAALMELGVQKLRINEITTPLAEDADDIYQMLQVHDYQSVSFFRMDPNVKAASKETIETFSMAYPELLAHKYFVNVPTIMGWMYGVMKLFLAPATLRKFHPMTSGTTLATELKGIQASLPQEYGGNGPSVREGETVKLDDISPDGEVKVVDEKEVATAPAAATTSTAVSGQQETKDLEESATADAELSPATEVEPAKKEVIA